MTLLLLTSLQNPFCDGFNLRPGSPAIDAGVVIPGFDCPVAGSPCPVSCPDNGPDAKCVEWFGSAPDIGACEFVPPTEAPQAPGSLTIYDY